MRMYVYGVVGSVMQLSNTHSYTHTRTHTLTHAYIHSHTYTRTHTLTHIHSHSYTHTHTYLGSCVLDREGFMFFFER
jgi:hypothetical protein